MGGRYSLQALHDATHSSNTIFSAHKGINFLSMSIKIFTKCENSKAIIMVHRNTVYTNLFFYDEYAQNPRCTM